MFDDPKPIIFLDIDGVLATDEEFNIIAKDFWAEYPEAKELGVIYPFNAECVKIFNEILDETSAEIILSSDWRVRNNIEKLDRIFKFNGVIKSPIDVTKINPISFGNLSKNRAHEIKLYIREHNIKHYVIIDDYHLNVYIMTYNVVRTSDLEGIKEDGIKEKIVRILIGDR